jgi:hypothetical protein
VFLYTYDEAGVSSYYTAVGSIVDGVFIGSNYPRGLSSDDPAGGDSLVRNIYRPAYLTNAPSTFPDAASDGQIRIDFSDANKSPACNDGRARPGAAALAAVRVTAGLPTGKKTALFCFEPIVTNEQYSTTDYSGAWYAGPLDQGWGATLATLKGTGTATKISGLLFLPDSLNQPRFLLFQADDFRNGTPIPLLQINGFCRTCATTDLVVRTVGSLTLNFNNLAGSDCGAAATNTIALDVTFVGTGAGQFVRTTKPLCRVTPAR